MRRIAFGLLTTIAIAACAGITESTDPTDEPTPIAKSESSTTTTASETTSSTRTSTTQPSSAEGSSLQSPVEVGAVVQVGDWRIRVTGLTPDATDQVMAENQFNDPPGEGNQFFIAALEATYIGTESSTFWVDMSLKAVGDSNVAYETFEASCGVVPDDIDDAGETFPGGTITGNVCWNIQSSDAVSLVMIAEESFSFDDIRAFLSLDPSATPVNASTAVDGADADREPALAIGEPANVGSWELKVIGVTPDATDQVMAENQFNDPPGEGNQFFIAALEATYIGSESSTFWVDMSLKAVGDSNVAYETFEASCGVVPDDIDDAGETFPGGTITGNVCWNIQSSDAVSLVMIAEESFSFDEIRAFFALTE